MRSKKSGDHIALRLSPLELRIMEAVWASSRCSVREIQETFPDKQRPAYTTVQTIVNRLEAKNAVRRVRKIGNAHIYEARVSRHAAQSRFVDELLSVFGWKMQPLMAHLIDSGKLTLKDVKEAKDALHRLSKKGASDD